jgi:hypothetical protein
VNRERDHEGNKERQCEIAGEKKHETRLEENVEGYKGRTKHSEHKKLYMKK